MSQKEKRVFQKKSSNNLLKTNKDGFEKEITLKAGEKGKHRKGRTRKIYFWD